MRKNNKTQQGRDKVLLLLLTIPTSCVTPSPYLMLEHAIWNKNTPEVTRNALQLTFHICYYKKLNIHVTFQPSNMFASRLSKPITLCRLINLIKLYFVWSPAETDQSNHCRFTINYTEHDSLLHVCKPAEGISGPLCYNIILCILYSFILSVTHPSLLLSISV